MSRSRNIKPGFFKNELLVEHPPMVRLLFIGLWCEADREGRLEYRPRRLRAAIFPYDDIDVTDGIAALADDGFLHVYEADGKEYIQISNWSKHQNPHHKEVGSVIPPMDGHVDTVCMGYVPLSDSIRRRIYARDGRVCRECGATHGLSIDHIHPISKGGNSVDENLQVLCLSCNARKGNKISSTSHTQSMHGSSTEQRQVNQVASCPTDSLIPDSLIPDSLIPDSREKQKGGKPPALTLPDWLPESAWLDWHAYRNSRKGWTHKARELSLAKLTKLRTQGHDPTAVIEQSIERGWTGLFEPKNETGVNHGHANRSAGSRTSVVERIKANNAAADERERRVIHEGQFARIG